MTKSKGSGAVLSETVRSAEAASMEVNKPLAERPLAMSHCWACDACGQVLAVQHPGEKVKTRGGTELKGPPEECTGTEEAPHGPWKPARHDYHSVVINAKDQIVRGRRAE